MSFVRALRDLLIGAIFASAAAAQDSSSAPGETSTRKGNSTAQSDKRLVSPHLAAMLAASAPKFKSPPENSEQRPTTADQSNNDSSDPIVRLPRYVVTEPKLPEAREALSKQGLEREAMDRYIGSADGLDRGFLNHFTIASLWKKIPVLKSFPFLTSETNEERGMRLFTAAEQKRKMDELNGLMKLRDVQKNPSASKK